MLEELLGYISSHGLPKAYILIDEYDNFTNQLLTSYNDSLYEEVTTSDSFLLTFFKVIKAGIGEGTIRTCFCHHGRPDQRVQHCGNPHIQTRFFEYARLHL